MTYLEVKINNSVMSLQLPSAWNELTPSQLLYIGSRWNIWRLLLKHNEFFQKEKAQLFIELILNHTKKQKARLCELFAGFDFEKAGINLLSLTDFIFEKNTLTENKLEYIKFNWRLKLYGPKANLSNVTIHELAYELDFYNKYNSTKDIKYLNLLICCLYRKKVRGGLKAGDIREPFNLNTTDRYLQLIDELPDKYKNSIYIFFRGCVASYSKLFPFVFETADAKTKTTQSTFLDIVIGMSGGKFGTFNETKNTNAALMLKELNYVLKNKELNK